MNKSKPIKLSPKRNGRGYITSYTVNIGSGEVKKAGFIDDDGNLLSIRKSIRHGYIFIDLVPNAYVMTDGKEGSGGGDVENCSPTT